MAKQNRTTQKMSTSLPNRIDHLDSPTKKQNLKKKNLFKKKVPFLRLPGLKKTQKKHLRKSSSYLVGDVRLIGPAVLCQRGQELAKPR